MPWTLYKLGGSLLLLPGLRDRLRRLFDSPASGEPLLMIGGGSTADVVRQWDAAHQLGEEGSHRLALGAMRLNESLLAELLPEIRLVADRPAAEICRQEGHIPLLSAEAFLHTEEPRSTVRLPHTWEATSDSIAAWIAAVWPAEELVLIKSMPLTENCTLEEASRLKLVDPAFEGLATEVPRLGWVNLRADTSSVMPIHHP